jgi:uncharacterized protein (TIGR02145 family)
LGADESLDPFKPNIGLNGNYYRGGRKEPVATPSTGVGAIAGWSSLTDISGGWSDTEKKANDPCPAGWRLPTSTEWRGVVDNNTGTAVGSLDGMKFGEGLYLPAAGYRKASNGALVERNTTGYYYSSSESGDKNTYFSISFDSKVAVVGVYATPVGLPIRCISEN